MCRALSPVLGGYSHKQDLEGINVQQCRMQQYGTVTRQEL